MSRNAFNITLQFAHASCSITLQYIAHAELLQATIDPGTPSDTAALTPDPTSLGRNDSKAERRVTCTSTNRDPEIGEDISIQKVAS